MPRKQPIRLRSIADCVTDVTLAEWRCIESAIDRVDALAMQDSSCQRLLYCEVGVFKGGTFAKVLDKCRIYHWRVVGIDLFDSPLSAGSTHISGSVNRDDLEHVLQAAEYRDFELLQGDSVTALKLLQGSDLKTYGVAFIDGDHRYSVCKQDAIEASRIFDKGYIILHNATEHEGNDARHRIKTQGGPYRVAQELDGKYGLRLVPELCVERCVTLGKGV